MAEGSADAAYALGRVYELGECGEGPDLRLAVRLYQIAAKRRSHEADAALDRLRQEWAIKRKARSDGPGQP